MLRVDPTVMNAATADLNATVNKMDQTLNELEQKVQAEIDRGWIGQAADSYRVSKSNWDRVIEELKLLLASNAVAVDAANVDFISADKRNAASLEVY